MEHKFNRAYLLYNPKSGRESIKGSLGAIVEELDRSGFEVVIKPTRCRGDGTSIAQKIAPEYDALICCGGDGTLNEVVTGIIKREDKLPVGYIPCGSTNDFGTTLGIDPVPEKAAAALVRGHGVSIDCGKIGDGVFVYSAAFGIFTDVSYETPHSLKAAMGHSAYLVEAVKDLHNIHAHHVTVEIDGQEILQDDFLFGMVTNSEYIGGIANLTGKDISLNDGCLELTLIRQPKNPADFNLALHGLVRGTENAFVVRRKIRHAAFTFGDDTSWTADGEYGGTWKHVEISCLPGAYRILL